QGRQGGGAPCRRNVGQASHAQRDAARTVGAGGAERCARRGACGAVRRFAPDLVLMARLPLIALMLLVPAWAGAQPATATAADYTEDGDAYCVFTRSEAAADSALLFSPQLFIDYGVVNGNDVSTGAGGITAGGPTQRLTAGARYSLMGLVRG